MHPVYLLAFGTFILVAAFAVWNLMSVRRNQKTGSAHASGIGGVDDPLSGDAPGIATPKDPRV